jgi:transaldolase
MHIDNPNEDNSLMSRPGEGLRLFLDSADPDEWSRFLPLGFFHGVTTNPLLLERAGQACSVHNLRNLAGRARILGAREIQMQTWGQSPEQMVETGDRLAELAESGFLVVIKVPATVTGFQAARILVKNGHSVTLTAVFTPGQVMAAAVLGASYAAPYLGRLTDAGQDGVTTVVAMHDLLTRTGATTRLLTASLRTAKQVVDLAVRGLDTFTFGTKVAAELVASDLTSTAAVDFQRAAEAMGEPS